MKFIFPQNYTFKNKIFGFIDYSVAIMNIIWAIMVGGLLHLFISDINTKIIIFIILCFPVFLLSISGIHGENMIYVFFYMFKFFIKQKLFFYCKTNRYRWLEILALKIKNFSLNFLSKKDITWITNYEIL